MGVSHAVRRRRLYAYTSRRTAICGYRYRTVGLTSRHEDPGRVLSASYPSRMKELVSRGRGSRGKILKRPTVLS